MTMPHQLDHNLDHDTICCRAVVETPAGSRAKIDFDTDSGLFELRGVLPAGMAFPLAFGFIPSTKGEDGDPIDVLILSEEALAVGCLLTLRLLGVIEAEQTESGETVRNDRLVGRLAQSRAYANITSLDQLGDGFAEELGRFFTTYNELKGKRFKVLATRGPDRAAELVANGAC